MVWSVIWGAIRGFDYRIVIDVLAIAWIIYRLLLLAKGTRAWQIIGGLLIFFAAIGISGWANLYAFNWLLRTAFPLGPVAIVILFLPELRHALEELGRPGFWGRSLGLVATERASDAIDAVVTAVSRMSARHVGALIVFERDTGLDDIVANGTVIDGGATAELLTTLFHVGTPLHDGAVIIRRGALFAAGCTLPLASAARVDATVHTRHKAAIGMSEESDAVVVVVSEETGTVSLAVEGRLVRGVRDDDLRSRLRELLNVGEARGLARLPIGAVAARVSDAIRGSARATSGKLRGPLGPRK